MSKIEDLSMELMQILTKYEVRGTCILVDDKEESLHSVSNMEGDESIDLIKELANNFTVVSKEVVTMPNTKSHINLADPNIN